MKNTTKQPKEKREKVISFRVTSAIADGLETALTREADAKVNTIEKLARKMVTEAVSDVIENGLFEGGGSTIPDADVLVGDAYNTLRKMKAEVIDVICTSPPYFQMRNYSNDLHEIGREKLPEYYISRLVEVFRECKRVLKPCGTLWIVIDDAYDKKQLLGLPWRLMLALQADGWIVRGEQVWAKTGMCEGASDRPTRDHEFVFLLAKKATGYFYDQDAIREPFASTWAEDCIRKSQEKIVDKRPRTNPFNKEVRHKNGQRGITRAEYGRLMNPLGRNKRSVWSVPPGKIKEAHYAAFPVDLAEICIRAGSPQNGIVCDPFCGAGSTGMAAIKHGRKFLGIELVPQFAAIARQRIENIHTHVKPL